MLGQYNDKIISSVDDIKRFKSEILTILELTQLTINDSTGTYTLSNSFTIGADDTGYDVKFYGATSGRYFLWDESADGVVLQGTLTVGVNDTGFDVKLFGATSGSYLLWDESADSLILNAAKILFSGTIPSGVDFTSATPTYSAYSEAGTGGRNTPFIKIGSWDDPLTIVQTSDHWVPLQINVKKSGDIAFDTAAARLRVDTNGAQATSAVGCLQLRQNLAHNLASSAIINASVNVSAAVTVGSGSLLGGYFSIEGSGAITKAGSNDCSVLVAVNNNTGATTVDNVFVALQNGTGTTVTEIIKVDVTHGTATSGINVANSAGTLTTGISISGATTTAVSVTGATTTAFSTSGTFSTAAGRAAKLAGTVNNPNFGDGYSFVESELTITGTAAGHVSAFGSWVNIITGTTGSNYICAQTNGVYEEATGTLTGSTVIFGMRMQSLLAEAPGESYPFSCVSNTNIITALFSCNAGSSDMGTVTNAGSDTSKLVPLYKETSTGTTYYVKLYSLAG